MAHDILLQSASRLQSTSAANDLSLYGAQPAPGLAFGPADPSDGQFTTQAAAAHLPDSAVAATASPAPSAQIAADEADNISAPPSLSPLASSMPTAASTHLTQEVLPLSTALMPLAPIDATGVSHLSPVEQLVSIPVEPLTANTAPNAPDGQIVGDETSLVATLAPANLSVLDPVYELVEDVTEPLISVVPATLSAVDDVAEDLLGSDPAAGIATLVSLVTIEVFDLADSVTTPIEAVSQPVELIDLLADDAGELEPLPVDHGAHVGDLPVDDLLNPILAATPLSNGSVVPDPDDLFGP